jgi:hypothetical protein
MTKHKKEKVIQKNDSKSDFFDEKKSDSKNDSKKVTPNIRNGLTLCFRISKGVVTPFNILDYENESNHILKGVTPPFNIW